MKTIAIDNSTWEDISRAITWQYDGASKLIAILGMFTDFFNSSTAQLWNYFRLRVVDIDNAHDFGLAIWGKILNCPRPTITIRGIQRPLSAQVYKAILKARFRILNENGSIESYCKHIGEAFRGNLEVTDGHDMGLYFSIKEENDLTDEEIALITDFPDVAFVFPAGVRDNEHRNDPVFAFDYEVEDESEIAETDPTITNMTDEEHPSNGSCFAWRIF